MRATTDLPKRSAAAPASTTLRTHAHAMNAHACESVCLVSGSAARPRSKCVSSEPKCQRVRHRARVKVSTAAACACVRMNEKRALRQHHTRQHDNVCIRVLARAECLRVPHAACRRAAPARSHTPRTRMHAARTNLSPLCCPTRAAARGAHGHARYAAAAAAALHIQYTPRRHTTALRSAAAPHTRATNTRRVLRLQQRLAARQPPHGAQARARAQQLPRRRPSCRCRRRRPPAGLGTLCAWPTASSASGRRRGP